MDIITPQELASYLREDQVEADLIIELANGLVSEALPDGVTEPTVRVRAITFEVAARAYRNPQGFSSETIDDYTYRRDADTRQAGLYLTDSERAELSAIGGGAGVTTAAFTIRPGAVASCPSY